MLMPIVAIFSTIIGLSSESKILGLFPHYGYSHFKVFSPILNGLAERGHNVTVVSYFENPQPNSRLRDILLTNKDGDGAGINLFDLKHFLPTRSLGVMFEEFWRLHQEGQKSCNVLYKSGAVEEIFRSNAEAPFDLVVLENFNTDCHLGIAYMLQSPIVGLSSCALMPYHYDRIGVPDMPSYIPTEFVGFTEHMGWYDRLVNFIVTKGLKLASRMTDLADNKIIKEHLHIDVDVRDIAKTTNLMLINQHYSLSGNRPLPQHVIEIGGIHIQDDKFDDKIPKDIEDFLQNSQHGVIFISWGSLLKSSTISKWNVKAIIEGLNNLPYNVIWKWENDEIPIKSDKFLFSKWVPQKSLLCHPKVKIFWSHGGLLGVSESVHCAKPLIVTPIYGDQFLNGMAVTNRKMGKIVHYNEITAEYIHRSFKEVSMKSYIQNAQQVSKSFRHRESTPLSKALWWIENVLQQSKGNQNLLYTKAVDLNWFVYYSLDSIVIIIVIIFIVVMALLVSIKLLKNGLSKKEGIKNIKNKRL